MILKNLQFIRIPNDISVFYFKNQNLILVKSKSNCRLCFINFSLLLINKKIYIKITKKQNFKFFLLFFFKEFEAKLSLKLRLVGIGFKIIELKNSLNKIFLLKLGYSHFCYCKIIFDYNVSCLKSTQIYISGFYFFKLKFLAAIIKSTKIPDIYKGKGFRYQNEILVLKQGKKL